jgi:predicted  nucleic acid-binding Zn-ribbon protein
MYYNVRNVDEAIEALTACVEGTIEELEQEKADLREELGRLALELETACEDLRDTEDERDELLSRIENIGRR